MILRMAKRQLSTAKINNHKLKDYEYSHKIQQHLQLSETMRAYQLMLQSHLWQVPLDLQTYRQLAERVRYMCPSHLELMYILMRNHFQPNQLMKDYAVMLAKSNNIFVMRLVLNDLRQLSPMVNEQVVQQAATKIHMGQFLQLINNFAECQKFSTLTLMDVTIAQDVDGELKEAVDKDDEEIKEDKGSGLQMPIVSIGDMQLTLRQPL